MKRTVIAIAVVLLVQHLALAMCILGPGQPVATLYQFRVMSFRQVLDLPVGEYPGFGECTVSDLAALVGKPGGVVIEAWVVARRVVYVPSAQELWNAQGKPVPDSPDFTIGNWEATGFLKKFFFATAESNPFAALPDGFLLVLVGRQPCCDEVGCFEWPCILGVEAVTSVWPELDEAAKPPAGGHAVLPLGGPWQHVVQSPNNALQLAGAWGPACGGTP